MLHLTIINILKEQKSIDKKRLYFQFTKILIEKYDYR